MPDGQPSPGQAPDQGQHLHQVKPPAIGKGSSSCIPRTPSRLYPRYPGGPYPDGPPPAVVRKGSSSCIPGTPSTTADGGSELEQSRYDTGLHEGAWLAFTHSIAAFLLHTHHDWVQERVCTAWGKGKSKGKEMGGNGGETADGGKTGKGGMGGKGGGDNFERGNYDTGFGEGEWLALKHSISTGVDAVNDLVQEQARIAWGKGTSKGWYKCKNGKNLDGTPY